MNFVFPFVIIVCFFFSVFTGALDVTVTSGIDGAKSAVETAISLIGIICFWSGILNIAEKGGASEKCEKLLSPVINRLFPKTKCKKNITMNIIANLFGAGNAATPAGISAIGKMDQENLHNPKPSREMCRFILINTASISIFPTTVLSILSSFGAKNPFSIVPLVWICSFLALSSALLAEKLFSGGEQK